MEQKNQLRQLIARRQFMQSAVAAGFGTVAARSAVGSAAAKRGKTDEGQVPALSTTDRLEDRRYVVAGTRAYVIGMEDGRFPAMGFHTRGEMGGIWSPPIKLLDGIWFGIDGEWLEPAERFTSSYGHIEMDLPSRNGLEVTRTDFVPDETRAALFGLHLTADHDEQITLTVDARSELMDSYPWGATTPSQSEYNLVEEGTFDGKRLIFRERGQPPVENAQSHDWAAAVGATHEPVGGETGDAFWGPQAPPEVAPAEGDAPKRYDDTAFRNGTGGQLRYEIDLAAGETNTIWIAVAGADFDGPNPDDARAAALDELDTALDDPAGTFEEKLEDRLERSEHSRFSIPGNRQLERALDWSKQNLADCVLGSEDLQIRDVDAGTSYPAPVGTVSDVRFLAAGYPDYPWVFATDGEYTAFASVAVGQFEPIKDHLRALRDVSEVVNDGSGKVVHEVVFDGSVYFGTNDDLGNTDETVKFPSAVALVWRWTGDDDFRDELYDYAKRGMEYVFAELDDDGDGWLEGLGNVEREGMGKEKLDVTVYAIRGLYDLADMARSKDDTETATWAEERARTLEDRFEETWWIPEIPQHADSIDMPNNSENDNARIYQRHWTGVTPMEAELRKNGTANPGLTTTEHGTSALSLRETDCYGGIGDDESEQRRNEGLYHTGAPGCDRGEFPRTGSRTEKQIFTINTAVMAVGEGNYGRLSSDEQQRFIDANTKLQLPTPDEQPGAMPEIAPSPLYGRSIDTSLLERAQVLQAWGNYGTVWPVVHQWLGVRPDMGRRQLSVVPQVPFDAPRIAGENIVLGDGAIAVSAKATKKIYRTTVEPNVTLDELVIGHVVPADAEVQWVRLDGEQVNCKISKTNRGREILVKGEPNDDQTLMIKTR